MMPTRVVDGCVLAPEGWVRGSLRFSGRIVDVRGERVPRPAVDDAVILPGFVDLHVHGAGGHDVMDGGEAVARIAAVHARHGTTALLATTVTADAHELRLAVAGAGRAQALGVPGGSRVLGVHLEGPYINDDRLGAQPPCARRADLDELDALRALAPVRVVTLAPEMAGHQAFITALAERGIVAQCGHSAGSYEAGVAALDAGMRGFTHLFNAMSPLHHREPGMVGAALAHACYAEVIPDLLHVHPGALRCALRAIPKLYAVTDATSATGMPDGEYRLGRHTVTKCRGGVRLADGTLAGSTLTMDRALRNLVSIGLELDDAARRLSTFPADYLGESDRGRLAVGAVADVLVFSPALDLQHVFLEGVPLDLRHA